MDARQARGPQYLPPEYIVTLIAASQATARTHAPPLDRARPTHKFFLGRRRSTSAWLRRIVPGTRGTTRPANSSPQSVTHSPAEYPREKREYHQRRAAGERDSHQLAKSLRREGR